MPHVHHIGYHKSYTGGWFVCLSVSKHPFPDTVVGPTAPQVATDMGDSLEFVDFGGNYTGRAVDITTGPCARFDDGGVKWCVFSFIQPISHFTGWVLVGWP